MCLVCIINFFFFGLGVGTSVDCSLTHRHKREERERERLNMLSWNGLFSRGFFFFFSEHPTTAIEVVRMVGGHLRSVGGAAWEQLKTRHNTLKEWNERVSSFFFFLYNKGKRRVEVGKGSSDSFGAIKPSPILLN